MDNKSKSLQDREPGFDSLPSVDPDREAPTDKIDEIVGGIMDEIQEDATGNRPDQGRSTLQDQGDT
ncbi:hypothetical protein [Paenibacillus physcomitrellae]|uniref:Uncharacterized protein n=1 Tax=Paenibacillus physcomitrellae TaxID=1619311 RepID=A0ABQ1FLU0_9BACL|nr:hypothetical protein [Paenibacillus physcomitrellae]GGA21289.1 hypothetical protein GCM10010917_02500 [Paenibacillus physcomitrellae]